VFGRKKKIVTHSIKNKIFIGAQIACTLKIKGKLICMDQKILTNQLSWRNKTRVIKFFFAAG